MDIGGGAWPVRFQGCNKTINKIGPSRFSVVGARLFLDVLDGAVELLHVSGKTSRARCLWGSINSERFVVGCGIAFTMSPRRNFSLPFPYFPLELFSQCTAGLTVSETISATLYGVLIDGFLSNAAWSWFTPNFLYFLFFFYPFLCFFFFFFFMQALLSSSNYFLFLFYFSLIIAFDNSEQKDI